MITDKQDEAAVVDIEAWADRIARTVSEGVHVSVYYDGDSSTYVLRLARASRVLLFRLSDQQVRTAAREAECEKTLRKKIADL